jgi:hypothetical protein
MLDLDLGVSLGRGRERLEKRTSLGVTDLGCDTSLLLEMVLELGFEFDVALRYGKRSQMSATSLKSYKN